MLRAICSYRAIVPLGLAVFLLVPLELAHAAVLEPGNSLGIVGEWSFDHDSATTAFDSSPYGNNGTFSGSFAHVPGKSGNALSAGAGGTGRFTVNSSASLQDGNAVTVAFWLNASPSSTSFASILFKDNNTNAGWQVDQSGLTSSIKFRVDTSGGTNQTFGSMTALDGTWHYIVYTLNAGAWNAYEDGSLVSSGTYNPGSGFAIANALTSNGNSAFPNLLLDDVRIYDRAISAGEVTSLYNANAANYGLVKRNVPTANGLVAYWPLDEGTGTRAGDHSGDGNNGTLMTTGSVLPTWVPGHLGQALSFDGATSYVQMSNGTALSFPNTTFTVSFWEKESVGNGGSWFLTNGGINGGWSIQVTGVVFLKDPSNNQSVYTPTAATTNLLKNGKWHHLVYIITTNTTTASAQAVTMYVDDSLDAGSFSAATTYGINNNFLLGARMANGTGNPPGNFGFNGTLDDIRIYNRALSTTEIANLYREESALINAPANLLSEGTALNSGLVGYWSFDGTDFSATSGILDQSGNSNNGFNQYPPQSGNLVATSSRVTIGKLGQGYSFAGLGSAGINVGNSATLDPANFTIAAWLYLPNPSYNYNYIFSNTRDFSSPQNGIGFLYTGSASQLVLFLNDNSVTNINAQVTIATSTWTHVAVTYDGSNVRFYDNGVLIATRSNTTGAGSPASYTSCLGSMGYSNCTTYTLQGKLDDVRLYNRALSAREVLQLYLLGK